MDKKISQLDAMLGAVVDVDADVIPIVDASAGTAGTKKISVRQLLSNTGLVTTLDVIEDTDDDAKGDALVGVKLEAPGSVATTQHARNESLPLRSDFSSDADHESAADAAGAQLLASQSRFKQSGTGATERTVQDKGREIVTPEDFGAAGDGTTDDTASLEKFFDRLEDGRLRGQMRGNYRITDTLVLKGVRWHLDARGSKIIPDSDVLVGAQLGTTASIFDLGSVSGLYVERASYDGSTENIGILYKNVANGTFHDLDARNFKYNHVFRPDTGDRVAYNDFINQKASSGVQNFLLDPQGSGFCNENTWLGGRGATSANTTRNLNIPVTTNCNNNRFYAMSLEGQGECAVYCEAGGNLFDMCRTEGTWTGEAAVIFDSNSNRNFWRDWRTDQFIIDRGTGNEVITGSTGAWRKFPQNNRNGQRFIRTGSINVSALSGSPTADTTAGSKDITVSSASGIAIGDFLSVSGGLQMGRVEKIDGTTITVDVEATATQTGGSLTRVNPPLLDVADQFRTSGISYVNRWYMSRFGSTSYFYRAFSGVNERAWLDGDGKAFFNGGVQIGSDVTIARAAANTLQLASGDSFRPESASGQSLGDSSHTWRVYHDVVATASLPAAGASMNGVILIEDAGAGDRNLIIYAGGERFRIDGGSTF